MSAVELGGILVCIALAAALVCAGMTGPGGVTALVVSGTRAAPPRPASTHAR